MKNLSLMFVLAGLLASDHAHAQSQEPIIVKQERVPVESVLYGKVHETKEDKAAKEAQRKKVAEDQKLLEKAMKSNPFTKAKVKKGFKRLPPNTNEY
jgi:hypothetical protein